MGAWTRRVFDLELNEPCEWNTNYGKLKEYIMKQNYNGKLLSQSSLDGTLAIDNVDDEEGRMLAAWLDGM